MPYLSALNNDIFNFNEFADSLQKAREYADKYKYKCCCPDCSEIAIKSHLLQRHPLLTSIADSQNKVFQFEDNWENAQSGRWDFYSEKVRGINDAMQYKLYCRKHDHELFKDLESHNTIPSSKHDYLLLAYRAACSVRHQEEKRMHLYEYKVKQNLGDLSGLLLKNSQAFILRMDAVIENLWRAIYGEDNSYIFRMFKFPLIPVAASDCIVDENDLLDNIENDGCRIPLNCYFINLIPDIDHLLLLLGCDTRYDRSGEYRRIISGFPSNCDFPYEYFFRSIWGILLKCHNWCCSPTLAEDPKWKEFFDEYEDLKINSE